MIIFRYLARDVLANTLGVSSVLMLVVVSSRFVKYLAEAASGKLDPNVLLAIIGFRLPGFFELILPLAFFLALLLAYGQFYVTSEMTVLYACGMSQKKLVAYTLVVASGVAAVVGWLSLVVSPSGFAKVEELINAQKLRGEIESLTPGRFYSLRANKGVTYAETISSDGVMGDVFLAQAGGGEKGMVIVVAKEGYSRQSQTTGERYLVLEDGLRVQGIPGRADFQLTQFEEYGQRLDSVKSWELSTETDASSTRDLLDSSDPRDRATLYWRISLPFMVMIVALMAVPLSRTNPRRGRFAKILPAITLYVLYLLALNAARGAIEDNSLYAALAMPVVHGIFLAIALVLVALDPGGFARRRQS